MHLHRLLLLSTMLVVGSKAYFLHFNGGDHGENSNFFESNHQDVQKDNSWYFSMWKQGNSDSYPKPSPSVLIDNAYWRTILERTYGRGSIGQTETKFLREHTIQQDLTEVKTPEGVKILRQWLLPGSNKRIASDWVTTRTPRYPPRGDVLKSFLENQAAQTEINNVFKADEGSKNFFETEAIDYEKMNSKNPHRGHRGYRGNGNRPGHRGGEWKPTKRTQKPPTKRPRPTVIPTKAPGGTKRTPRSRGPVNTTPTKRPTPIPTLPPGVDPNTAMDMPETPNQKLGTMARLFQSSAGQQIQEVLTQVVVEGFTQILRQYFNFGNGAYLGGGMVGQQYWDQGVNDGGWGQEQGVGAEGYQKYGSGMSETGGMGSMGGMNAVGGPDYDYDNTGAGNGMNGMGADFNGEGKKYGSGGSGDYNNNYDVPGTNDFNVVQYFDYE